RDLIVTGVQTCALPISLQFVRDKTLTAFDASRLNLHGQTLAACRHLLSNRFIGSCIEFGERRVECRLKGERCTQGRHVRSTFVRSEERRVGKGCRAWGW